MRSGALLSTGLAAALLSGACGGDDGDEHGGPLTKAAYVARANAICQGVNQRIEEGADRAFPEKGLVPTAEQLDTFSKETLVPQLENELRELKELHPPKDDESRIDQILEAGQKAVDEIKSLPASVQTSPSVLDRYDELANSYDLKTCGQTSQTVRRVTSGLKPGATP